MVSGVHSTRLGTAEGAPERSAELLVDFESEDGFFSGISNRAVSELRTFGSVRAATSPQLIELIQFRACGSRNFSGFPHTPKLVIRGVFNMISITPTGGECAF